MATSTTGILSVLLTALAVTAMAQDVKLKRDVTYSPNNYKHANKAAEARRWEQKRGLVVRVRDARQFASDDYKQHTGSVVQNGGITVESAVMPEQNYKTQQWLKAEEPAKHTLDAIK